MANELVVHSVPDMERMAKAIADSGLFGVTEPTKAFALMLVAQAQGLHPAQAAMDYNVIQGRPALKADAMMARFQKSGGKVDWSDYTDTKVTGVFSHPQGGSVEVSWDMDRAKAAGLGGKDNWKKWPRQMLRARVISEGIRTTFPGVTSGFYAEEEVQDFDAKPMKDVTPEFKAEVAEIMATPAKRGRPAKVEPASEAIVEPLFDTPGKRTGYVGKQIQTIEVATLDELKALRESEQKFWAAMKASDEPLDVQGAKDIIDFYNERLKAVKEAPKPAEGLDDF